MNPTKNVLVINAGSSSLKYQVVDPDTGEAAAKGLIERVGTDQGQLKHEAGDSVDERAVEVPDHAAAVAVMREALQRSGIALDSGSLVAVGHRIVHGGRRFSEPTLIDEQVESEIDRVSVLAPLHNPGGLAGVRSARAAFPDLPHVAVFDTAFFADLPAAAATYAIDREVADEHAIRRYGFHGTSHEYVSKQVSRFLGRDDLKQVVLHLGNGASASAVDAGRPVETSMGMTPLEGLVMGTRSGDLDPGITLHLSRVAGLDRDSIDDLLNRRSGILGLGGHRDFRDLVAARDQGDPDASLAFEVYVHRLVKYVGAYAAVLGGLDALTFTAGVGENSPVLRAAVVERLGFLGAELDASANEKRSGEARRIDRGGSVAVLVVPTNEEWAIASHALEAARFLPFDGLRDRARPSTGSGTASTGMSKGT